VGSIRIQEGGSARNSAECIARLGLAQDLIFISSIGEDQDKAEIIKNSLKKVQIVRLIRSEMNRISLGYMSRRVQGLRHSLGS
jgi:hypothetical protein